MSRKMSSYVNREKEIGNTSKSGVDDCLTRETRKVWSLLKDPKISIISIWGWDGIGKSIIVNKIMEGAKKDEGEAHFDVVIAVSVPQSLMPPRLPDLPSSDVRMQRQLTTPTSPITHLQQHPAWASNDMEQELEKLLENPSERKLTKFKDEFQKKREKCMVNLSTFQKVRSFEKMYYMAKAVRTGIENSVLKHFFQSRRLELIKEMMKLFQRASIEEATKSMEIERKTKERVTKLEEENRKIEGELKVEKREEEILRNQLHATKEKADTIEIELKAEKERAAEAATKSGEEIHRMELELKRERQMAREGAKNSQEEIERLKGELQKEQRRATEEGNKAKEEIQSLQQELQAKQQEANKYEEEKQMIKVELETQKKRAAEEANKLSERIENLRKELEGEQQRAAQAAKKSEEKIRELENKLLREREQAIEAARKSEEKIKRLEDELQRERQELSESKEANRGLERENRINKWIFKKEMRRSSKALELAEEELEEERRRAKEERRRELQEKIVAELKVNVGKTVTSAHLMEIVANRLARKKLLLILKDVWEHIDLKEIGVPLPNPDNGSKVIIVPTKKDDHSLFPDIGKVMIIQDELTNLLEEEAWQLLNVEAKDAATFIPLYPTVTMEAATFLECFSYVSLFPPAIGIDEASLKEHWRCEGFLTELTQQVQMAERHEEARVEECMGMILNALVSQLSERCFLNYISAEHKFLMMPDGARKIVSSRNPNLLIRCGSELRQVPELKGWESAGRISLSHNLIRKLHDSSPPPNSHALLSLFLNHNESLDSISDDFFRNMSSLRVLNLSSTAIHSLPSSLSSLGNLRMLKLRNCRNLECLPNFLKELLKLEVLDLGETPLPKMIRACFDEMPSLRLLDISGGAAVNAIDLSIRDSGSLSKLVGLEEGPEKLESLDLSGTKIESIPHQVFRRTSLKLLVLLRMEHLKTVQWNEIEKLPKELNWCQWSFDPLGQQQQQQQQGSNGRFLVSTKHDSVFHSLDQTSQLSQSRLQKFYFLVCPCKGGPKYRHTHFGRSQFPYNRIYSRDENSVRNRRLINYERCMEVCGGNSSLAGIKGVLSMTDFYCLRGNELIKTVFGDEMQLANLKECWIDKCHQLESVIDLGRFQPRTISVAHLKHLYLQHCPKLINFLSSNIQLKELESLEIKFCGRLQKVHEDVNAAGEDAFPKLAELCLWELGKLERICGGYLPKLKKLQIRGCPLLKQLPLNNYSSLKEVQVRGEEKWWKSIKWERGINPGDIGFKASQPI